MNIRQIPQIVEVGSGDDLITVASTLAESPTREVYLVIPEEAHLWRNVLNFQLLGKQLARTKKAITVITGDEGVAHAARRAELPVLQSLPSDLIPYTANGASQNLPRNSQDESQNREDEKHKAKEELYPSARKMYDIVPPEASFSLETPIISKPFVTEEEIDGGEDGGFIESEEGKEEEEEPEVVSPEDYQDLPLEVRSQEKAGLRSRFRVPDFTRYAKGVKTSSSLFWGAVLVFTLLAAGVFFFGLIPRTTITIVPERESVRIDIDIQASSNLSRPDAEGNIPAQFVTVEKDLSKNFIPSGVQEVREKAKGTITIYNAHSSSPQTLVETTRLVSQDGKTFRTTKTVVVPGALLEEGRVIPSSIDVEVIAAEAGEEYNISPSTFSVPGFKGTPKYTGFYGKSTASMSGGFVGEAKIATKDDIEKAKETLESELFGAVREDFNQRLPRELVLLEEAKKEEIVEIMVDKNAGDAADSFTVAGRANISGILFEESHVREVVETTLLGHFEDRELSLEGLSVSLLYRNVHVDFSAETLMFSVHIEQSLARRVDTNEIKEALRGKDEIEVRKYLGSREDIESARVVFFPRFLVRTVPDDPSKIEVVIE